MKECNILPFYLDEGTDVSNKFNFDESHMFIRSEKLVKTKINGPFYLNDELIDRKFYYWKPEVSEYDLLEKIIKYSKEGL